MCHTDRAYIIANFISQYYTPHHGQYPLYVYMCSVYSRYIYLSDDAYCNIIERLKDPRAY